MKLHIRIPVGVKNGIAIIIGEGSSRLLLVLGGLYAARKLGAESYGQYGIYWAQLMVAWCVIEFGTGLAGTREIAAKLSDAPRIIASVLALRFLLWLGVSVVWSVGSILSGSDSALSLTAWAWMLVYLLLQAATPDWILRSQERFKQLGVAQFVGALVFCLVVFFGLAEHWVGMKLLLGAHLSYAIATFAISWMLVPNTLRLQNVSCPEWRQMRFFFLRGGMFALTGILLQGGIAAFLWQVNQVFGVASAGIATILMRIYQLLTTVSFMLGVGYFPRLAKQGDGDEADSLRKVLFVSGGAMALAFPVALMLAENLILGKQYQGLSTLAWGAALGLWVAAQRYGLALTLTAQYRHLETILANSVYFLIFLLAPIMFFHSIAFHKVGWLVTFAEAGSTAVLYFMAARQPIRWEA